MIDSAGGGGGDTFVCDATTEGRNCNITVCSRDDDEGDIRVDDRRYKT